MKVADMPEFKNRTQVLSCRVETTVYEAVVSMVQRRCGAIAVTKGEKLIGIFTERDLLTRVVGQGRDVETTVVGDVMTGTVETAFTTDSASLCMGRMNHGRFRHMPVVDKEGNLAGMLSQRDFLSYAMREVFEKQ